MLIVSDGAEAPPAIRGAAAALGNFDGVHLGHQAVLAAVAAAAEGRPLAAAVFEPHPRRFFQPEAAPFRLQSSAQRARALEALGLAALFEIAFTPALAALDAEAFCREVLAARLGVGLIAVGADFRFGRQRGGDAATLAALGETLGFATRIVTPVEAPGGGKVSSTAIRGHIEAGRPEAAAALLSRPFAIEGEVAAGAQRGRTIGVPTANVPLSDYVRPAFGVYAVEVDAGDGVWRPGVANIGVKPTVGGAAEPLLEAHIFDFEGDLYGRRIETRLRAFLRPERRFESFDALKAQIAADIAEARARLT